MKVQLELPPKLVPLFTGEADVRAADGGRGSAKTRAFAKMTAVRALMWDAAGREGQILCGRQFMNSLADSSLEEVKAAIRSEPWLLAAFEIGDKYVKTKSGRIYYTFAGLDRSIASIKSKARILLCWVDEAEPVTDEAWTTLIPTLREEDSELWVTWNSKRKNAPVEKRFKNTDDPLIKYVRMNWRDNPWFPDILERVRQRDLKDRPEQYDHIWEGDFVSVVEGAYYSQHINKARQEGRIGKVAADPLMTIRAIWDIGGTGAKADACAIWIAQYVGREIRWLDYYEAQGQPLATHIAWLRSNGYGNALCVLPHDGATNDRVHDVSYESALRQAGFEVQVIANQGAGAAMKRVEAARRLFPSMWFDERCEPGLDAIGWYHEKRDEERGIGLGPEHDWSSHCFVGETEVLTRYGTQQIKNLPYTGEVLTACGWKAYRNPRVTRVNAPLVEVAFADGLTVKCTPDHMFLTDNGWKSAESLSQHTVIQSTLTKSRNILTAGFIGFGSLKRISRVVAGGFTAMFGQQHLGLFHRVATSAIRTGTFSTTCWPILNAFQRQSICLNHGQNVLSPKMAGSAALQETKLLNGMLRQRGDFGTLDTLNAPKAGQNGSGKKNSALNAARSLMRWFERAAIARFIARKPAKSRHIETVANQGNGHVTVQSVKRLNETADVWCLTVPEAESFSLSNGAIVHNCADAFGLGAVAYEMPQVAGREPKFERRAVV